jgi:hypothetical protein
MDESGLAKSFAAAPPAAPVRTSVRRPAEITARGMPVSGSFKTRTPATVGSPFSGFFGWELTTLTPAKGRPGGRPALGRYAGMARRSPPNSLRSR